MKKIILTILSIFFITLSANAVDINSNYLSKGAFIPVHPTKALSTSLIEENDTFFFIVPNDMWIETYKIIPKDSIIKGHISMLKMPMTGINAAMSIDSDEIYFPDGRKYILKGYFTYRGEKKMGGNLTPPLSYNKSLHPWKGQYFDSAVAQYVPSGEYEFGQHLTIPVSEKLYVVLDEDFSPY